MREEMKNTKKLDNKGFSLIELIIVIAIMAILVGIVGTQVVPYIEKSKQAKDQQVISSLLTSATTAFASNAESYAASSTEDKKIIVGSGISAAGADMDSVLTEFKSLSGFDDTTTIATVKAKLSSKAGKDITSIEIQRTGADGVITVTVLGPDTTTKIFTPISST